MRQDAPPVAPPAPPGSASLELAGGARLLRPEEQVFEAMLEGWRVQQLARNLATSTAGKRATAVRAFTRHADAFPWAWTAQMLDEWLGELRGIRGLARSTIRAYGLDVSLFVPDPFAQVLLLQAAHATATTSAWLFPGRNPGQPAAYITVFNQLRSLGFPMRTGRISALRELAAQAPPPVIADALGFHQTTTHRQHVNAGTTWSRYATR